MSLFAALLSDAPQLQGPGLPKQEEPSEIPAEPAGRIFHSAVWTGTEVIVWGGGAEGSFHNGGYRIDPVQRRTVPLSRDQAPDARWAHAAVWTGSRVIIWGGRPSFTSTGNKRSGALYDPAAGAWKTITEEGAPEGRSQMAAVWTGREMLVWGGFGEGSTAYGNGGRYDPAADRWSVIPKEGAPSPRVEPLYVWTGTEMIIWGGITGDLKRTLSDGAAFNPSSNTWTPIKESDSPRGVWGTNAVWSGSEMLFWGGAHQNGDENVNEVTRTGAAYNPSTRSWRTLPAEGTPCARFFHSSVWTGDRMIVWGGGDQAKGSFNDGAEFIPAENAWRPLSWANPPAARGMHTATWTVRSMVVYGGSTGDSSAFSGPEYYLPR